MRIFLLTATYELRGSRKATYVTTLELHSYSALASMPLLAFLLLLAPCCCWRTYCC
jgi:hypothetical protein